MMEHLNNNSEVFIAFFTFILVIITGWYVYITSQLLKVNSKPEVIVYLLNNKTEGRPSENHSFGAIEMITTLCVQNVGRGVARNIKFGGDLSFCPYGGEPLENIEFFKKGITLLAPAHRIKYRRNNPPIVSFDVTQTQVDIKIIYEDLQGKKYSNFYTLDFSQSAHLEDNPL